MSNPSFVPCADIRKRILTDYGFRGHPLMVYLRGTLPSGEVLDYGIPIDEPFRAIERDAERFDTLEIMGVDYAFNPNVND